MGEIISPVRAKGEFMRADIVPGAVFPDYELTDHAAKRRKLSDLQGADPMIVVLSRGGFCPKDRRQAEGLLQLHREMEVGYCRAGDHQHRQSAGDQRVSDRRRSALAIPFRRGADSPEGSGHRGVHGSRQQSDDPAYDRAGAGADRLQDLQRILVLRTANGRRSSPGSARRCPRSAARTGTSQIPN